MTAEYERSVQLPTGAIRARLILPGDLVLIRKPGQQHRTANEVLAVDFEGRDVILTFEGYTHRTSHKMPVGITTREREDAASQAGVFRQGTRR